MDTIRNPYKSDLPRYFLLFPIPTKEGKYFVKDRHTAETYSCYIATQTDIVHFEIKGIKLTKIK